MSGTVASTSTLTYGLNSGGFVRMRLPEIRQLILSELKARTGFDFDDSPDSFTGQLIAIFAERMAAMWELAEQAYLSAYPATAQGLPLDLAVSYAGAQRLKPVKSRADVYVLGDPGTVAPEGTIVQALVASDNSDVPPRFVLQYDVTITKASAITAQLTINPPITAGAQYWIEISGVRYTYTALSGQSEQQVALNLANMIGNVASLTESTIIIFQPFEFTIDWSNNFFVNYLGSTGVVLSENYGPIPAVERTIRKIINPVPGLLDIYNPYAAVLGQILEADDKLRLRYQTGVYQLGAGTKPSIDANVKQNIAGVRSSKLLVNDADVSDANGLPPHSIELIVEGGDDQAILNEIHRVKGAGITSFGNTTGTVRDADGYLHPLAFSRPEMRWIWLRVSFGTDPEESIPGDIAGQIIAAILEEGATFVAGQDVSLQRLQAAPFRLTRAINRVTVTAAVTAPNAITPVVYSAADISIAARQKAALDISRIFIIP